MTDPIKAKIQELCPDVMDTMLFEGSKGWQFGHKTSQGYYWNGPYKTKDEAHLAAIADGKYSEKKITLAVVLRAAVFQSYPPFTRGGHILDVVERWNLFQDNYDQQSEECKQFIGSLLTNEK